MPFLFPARMKTKIAAALMLAAVIAIFYLAFELIGKAVIQGAQ